MSISPNDSFEQDSPSNSEQDPSQPVPKKSSKGCLIVAVILLVFFVLICGCCGFGVYYSIGQLEAAVKSEAAADPAILEHIGEIETVDFDFSDTIAAAEGAEQAGDPSPVAFVLKGAKGEGTLLVMLPTSAEGDGNQFQSATLVLPDGTRIPLETIGSETDSEIPGMEGLGDDDLEGLFDAGEATFDLGEEVIESESPDLKEPANSEPASSEPASSEPANSTDDATGDTSK